MKKVQKAFGMHEIGKFSLLMIVILFLGVLFSETAAAQTDAYPTAAEALSAALGQYGGFTGGIMGMGVGRG